MRLAETTTAMRTEETNQRLENFRGPGFRLRRRSHALASVLTTTLSAELRDLRERTSEVEHLLKAG